MSRFVFWAATLVIAWTYAGFPLVTLLRARLRPRPVLAAEITPAVSVVIAARNEAEVIEQKIESLLALDYPPDRLQVVIASDGSDDATVARARARGGDRVDVLDLPRVGKGAALGAAVDAARHEILVFSDANSLLAPSALRALVRPLADAEVGGVAGNQVYESSGGSLANGTENTRGERSYWDFDRVMKHAQSEAGHAIAATGALYAIRRGLFRPIPVGVTDDFFLSLCVVDAGRRLVFAEDAVVTEQVAPSRSLEYRRKVRIMTRGLRCLASFPQLLDPRRAGFYAIQLLSHKVLMRTMGIPLIAAFVTALRAAPQGPVYALAAISQLAFYALAAAGAVLARRPAGRHPLLALPAYFALVQLASLHAAWNLLTGRRVDRWEPGRRHQADER